MDDFEERWEVYPSRVGEQFAMYSVNLGVNDGAPFANLRWMNLVRLTFEAGPGGMPSGDDSEVLFKVEDFLHTEAAGRGAAQVGRLTYGGRRELFFYSATNDADVLQNALEKTFPDLDIETFAQDDPEWSVYFDFLYPTPIDFQRIRNQHSVRALHDNGDNVDAPRQIEHSASFRDADTRRIFRKEMLERDFTIVAEPESDIGPRRFGLQFASHGPVDLASIDKLTIPMLRRIEILGGTYDGWACLITPE